MTNLDGAVDVDARLSDRQFRRKLESYAAERDLYRHITTLSTGAIVLMTTFIEHLFAQPRWTALIGYSLGGFAMAIVGCVIMHVLSTVHADSELSMARWMPTRWVGAMPVILGFGGFVFGVACLTMFAIRNLP